MAQLSKPLNVSSIYMSGQDLLVYEVILFPFHFSLFIAAHTCVQGVHCWGSLQLLLVNRIRMGKERPELRHRQKSREDLARGGKSIKMVKD